MVNSSLTRRRVVIAAGFSAVLCLSGCSAPSSSTRGRVESSQSPAVSTRSTDRVVAEPAEANVYVRRLAEYQANPVYRESHPRRILYADALLHLGDTRRAIQELIDTEIAFPESYLNAVYLGLAYESSGDLKSARYWVSRSIERNVDARGGSEWLHLAMLDARLALAKDSNWLRSHSVLANNTHRTAEEILSAIKIQLAIRGDFGLPTDAVVSDLYFEAGICAPNYALRQEYFAQSLEISALRRSEIEEHAKLRAKAHATVQAH